MQAGGLEIRAVSLPACAESIEAHRVLTLSSAVTFYQKLSGAETDQLAAMARSSLAVGRTITRQDIAAAETSVARLDSDFRKLFCEVDVLLTPTLRLAPPLRDARQVMLAGKSVSVVTALIAETCLANLVGCPALSMPVGPRIQIPASVQLIAPRGEDLNLLVFAKRLIRLIVETCQ
jgi:Asp-tRNA(Asn)/Glu-tRNA(Gln) amidotransferase A subunit family amidase